MATKGQFLSKKNDLIRAFIILCLMTLGNTLLSQQGSGEQLSLLQSFKKIEKEKAIQIYYLEAYLPSAGQFSIKDLEQNTDQILTDLLANTGLSFLNYKNHAYIVAPKDRLELDYDQKYFERKIEQEKQITSIEEKIRRIPSWEQ